MQIPPTNSEGPLASASADPLSELWRKLSRPAAYSRHLPTLELGAYDAEDALAHDACFHASDSALDDEDVRSLGLALTKAAPASLKSIHLGGNALRGGSLAALLAALPAAPALETLWLADNELDGAAMAAFAMCTGNGGGGGALKHLSLQRNRVGDDGAASLAAALAGGALPVLELLYLGENEVGDAGATALAEALRGGACPKLRRLGLQANCLGDGALEALAAALRAGAMKGGEFLYVGGNPFTPAGEARDALCESLRGGPLQCHFGWPPPKTKSFLITPPDRYARAW